MEIKYNEVKFAKLDEGDIFVPWNAPAPVNACMKISPIQSTEKDSTTFKTLNTIQLINAMLIYTNENILVRPINAHLQIE